MRRFRPRADLRDLVRYATLAANGHNTQPWRFAATGNGVAIAPDLSRRTPIVDPDDHHLFVSLGCAAENLSLAARAAGRAGTPEVGDGRIEVDLAPGAAETGPLVDAIPQRQCTRADYDGSPIDPALVDRLRAAAAVHRTEAIFISAPDQVNDVLDLVLAGNAAQIGDPAFVQELLDWLRFSPAAAARHGDGLFAGSSGSPEIPDWAGRLIFRRVFTVASETDRYVRQTRSSSGLMVLVGPSDDPTGWMHAGLACQRLSLVATAEGLKFAFLNQAVEDPPPAPACKPSSASAPAAPTSSSASAAPPPSLSPPAAPSRPSSPDARTRRLADFLLPQISPAQRDARAPPVDRAPRDFMCMRCACDVYALCIRFPEPFQRHAPPSRCRPHFPLRRPPSPPISRVSSPQRPAKRAASCCLDATPSGDRNAQDEDQVGRQEALQGDGHRPHPRRPGRQAARDDQAVDQVHPPGPRHHDPLGTGREDRRSLHALRPLRRSAACPE